MREIKFRAWIVDIEKMASWEQTLKECDRFSLLNKDGFIFMQYTGLKDKQGKEIYDGDVVLCDNEFYAPVLWNDKLAQWCIQIGHTLEGLCEYCNCHIAENCEVVGNIHDNPELLEEEK